jgi:hypothetical protein
LNSGIAKTLSQSGKFFIGNENGLSDKSYIMTVSCSDLAGNIASKSISFVIKANSGGGSNGGSNSNHKPDFISDLNDTEETSTFTPVVDDYVDATPIVSKKSSKALPILLVSTLILLIIILILLIVWALRYR